MPGVSVISKIDNLTSLKSPADRGLYNLHRAYQLKIKYIDSSEFHDKKKLKELKSESAECVMAEASLRRETGSKNASIESPSLGRSIILTINEEQVLFRQMNYCKYIARSAQLTLIAEGNSRNLGLAENILSLVAHADQIRNFIVECNLRLIPLVLGSYVSAANRLDTVISDGALILMGSARDFDYTRGNRFSTYATWALKRAYGRIYYKNIERSLSTDCENLASLLVTPEIPDQLEIRELFQVRMQFIKEQLELLPRKHQKIIALRSLKEDAETQERVAQRFGVHKATISKTELQILSKIKHSAIAQVPQLFDD